MYLCSHLFVNWLSQDCSLRRRSLKWNHVLKQVDDIKWNLPFSLIVMHDFSWYNEFVLEFVPSEAFFLAYLSGDKDRLRTGMVFAKFPRKKMSTAGRHSHFHLPPAPSRTSGIGIKTVPRWHLDCGVQHFLMLPSALKNASSHTILCHCNLRVWTSLLK